MLATGTEIGGYRIESVLGRGGMGVVYEATQLSLGRTVALKLLDAALSDDETFHERFRMEGRIQARLDHPNIIAVYEAGELPEGLFIAMRLIRGPNLKQLVRTGELDPARILRLLEPIADALDTAHEAGLTHRDVKPQNILVDRRDHAYLADFGISKPAGVAGMTRTGHVMGTLDYLSPEQIRGEPATWLSDVYALAAMTYECLVGRVPFPKDTEAAVLYAHISEPPPRASTQAAGLPPAVDAVLAAGMAKEPSERPQSASALIRGLQEALGGSTDNGTATPVSGLVAPPPPPAPPQPPMDAGVPTASVEVRGALTRADPLREPPPEPEPEPPPRSPGLRVLAAAGLVALALGGTAGAVLGGPDPAPEPPEPERFSSGPIAFTAPAEWSEAAEPIEIAGLKLNAPVAAQPPGSGATAVVAGFTEGSGATLLPERFRKRLADVPKRGDRVRLGKYDALRFDRLEPKKGDPLRVFTTLTDKGVATVVCVKVADAATCDRIAASMALKGVEAERLVPDRTYGGRIRRVVARLGTARDAQLKALRAAKVPSAQAIAAAEVAGAYSRATKALGDDVEPGPMEFEVHRDMFNAFRDGAVAYVALARSAAKGERAWRLARRKAEKADADARRAVLALETLGYEVR